MSKGLRTRGKGGGESQDRKPDALRLCWVAVHDILEMVWILRWTVVQVGVVPTAQAVAGGGAVGGTLAHQANSGR